MRQRTPPCEVHSSPEAKTKNIAKISRLHDFLLHLCRDDSVCGRLQQSRARQTRETLHKKAPVTVPGPGLSNKPIRVMPFAATFVSIAAILGCAVTVLTAVVGFGCYRFLRDLFGRAPSQLDA